MSTPHLPALAFALCLGFGAPLAYAADAAGLIQAGEQAWEAGDTAAAQQQFEQAVAEFPDSFAAANRLAGFYLMQQRYKDSVAHYQTAIGLQPDTSQASKAFIGMGMAYLHLNNPWLARAAFKEALQREPQRQEKLAPIMADLEQKIAALERAQQDAASGH